MQKTQLETINTNNMDVKVSKTFMKVIGFAGSALLTIFAGIFAMVSLSALVMSVIEKDLLSVIASAAAGFIAWMMWDIRKDTLL